MGVTWGATHGPSSHVWARNRALSACTKTTFHTCQGTLSQLVRYHTPVPEPDFGS